MIEIFTHVQDILNLLYKKDENICLQTIVMFWAAPHKCNLFCGKFEFMTALILDWSLHQNWIQGEKAAQKNIVPSHKTGRKKLESAIDSGKEKPLLIVPVICCLPTSDSRARLPHPSSGSIPLFLKYYSRHNLIFMSQFYSFSPRMWPMVIAKFRLTSAWF